MTRAVYTRSQLMTLLGYKCPKSFRARLPALYAVGFPLPLPLRGPQKWSLPQVDHWIATGGRTLNTPVSSPRERGRCHEGAEGAPSETKVNHLDAARARLAVQANRFSS